MDNLIYGRHPVVEALENGKRFDKLFLQKGVEAVFSRQIQQLARQNNVLVQVVPIEKMNRLTTKNHQGIAGFLSVVTYYELSDLLIQAFEKGELPLFLLCDGITDVGNFGAMARSAACMGVHGIVITEKGSASISPETIKASAGALNQIAVCKVRFLDQAIRLLQDNGVQLVVTHLSATQTIAQAKLSLPTAILMGAEDRGVSPAFVKMADTLVKIPMVGDFDSFNVSVATGILLYEVVRQRNMEE